MSRKPTANGAETKPTLTVVEGRDPRALLPLDNVALVLVALALVLAPLLGGSFATPPNLALLMEGPFSSLTTVGIPLITALVALAVAVTVWREGKRPVAIGAVPGLAGAMLLLGAWASLSVFRSHALYLSLNALSVLLAALMVGGLVSRLSRDRNGFAALLVAVIVAGSLVALLGLREYLFKWREGIWFYRTFATFANPDFLAGYLLLTLPLTLAAFASVKERLARFGFGIGLALQSACLLLTGSRAGVAVLGIAILFWLLMLAVSKAAARRWSRVGLGLALFVVFAAFASAPTRSRVVNENAPTPAPTATAPSAPGNPAPTPPAKPAGGALSAMEATAESQSHSGSFRRYTWIGTVNMAKANPALGTGIGTFEIAYPRYAETAFTAHAHNSYFQLMGEIGFPGLLFLLAGLAIATAFATRILLLFRNVTPEDDEPEPATPGLYGSLGIDAPGILLAGLLASVFATLLHSFIDSDWYIVGTVITLSVVVALLIALARDLAPLATQTPRPLAGAMLGAGVALCLFVLWRAGTTGIARWNEAEAKLAFASGQGQVALTSDQAAASADPLDPEPRLELALIYAAIRRPDDALAELTKAVQAAPIGKTFYRLGQFYLHNSDLDRSATAFEQARNAEPRNLQNMHALADVYKRAGKSDRAAAVYQEIVALEHAPYGQVRAMPEVVETDFGYAHAGLADIAYEANRWADATAEYERAAGVMREFWQRRNQQLSQAISTDKRQKLTELYDSILTRWQDTLTKQGKTAEAAKIAAEQAQFHKERDAEGVPTTPTMGDVNL